MDLGDALAWLDGHQNLEAMLADTRVAAPDLSRMRRLVDLMGHPEAAAPVIQVTGTNGKTSTARDITALLMAKGLTVGTFTSPHLERINERISFNGESIADVELAELLSDLAGLEPLLGEGCRLTWFEILTGAALRWFADRPVDVMVVEVGLGGRWDATNVVDAVVAVVTNVGLDHAELLGPTRADIAREKAGIIKAGSVAVIGEPDPELLGIFTAEASSQSSASQVWWTGREFACSDNVLAVGGRSFDVRTPGAWYEGVWLDLHGRHQADNFVAALVATEAFFGAPVEESLVRHAAGTVRSPGRLEVVRRHPLVVLDGAKNVEGARRAAAALSEEFGAARSRILVVGMLQGKEATEMLDALEAPKARLVVACAPPSPRAQPAETIAAAAESLGVESLVADGVPDAVELAIREAGPEDVVLVAGSLYVVGAARAALGGRIG
ncbi:MAG: bifunctional folylpolyglutamate synthase/dihydrofolate synthase [Acidimicrobiales bacterium]